MIKTMALSYFADVDQIYPSDTTLYAAPMSHGAGLYSIMHVLAGARHAIPISGGFDEEEIFNLAEKLKNVHMFAAPTMVKRLTSFSKKNNKDGSGIRTVVYAGGPMYVSDIIEAVDKFGPLFVQVYGQGECPMGITVLPRSEVADRKSKKWKERLQSVGYAQSAVEVKIGNKTGGENKTGEIGEIMVRGDLVMPGYWSNKDATSKTIIDGWLMTGDMGAMDADGYVTMHDRSKDMIISGGSNIYPREVEEVLLIHPSVSEVSVVGRESIEWGEEVVAFIVMEKGYKFVTETLDQHCLKHIARFKRPKDYVQVSELPKNNYGKVLKTVLRETLKQKTQG
jgi:long-chain acyl-CoA synthetase